MANTAQVNQPLSAHPLPWAARRILGAGSVLVSGAAPQTDTNLFLAPNADPNGSVVRAIDLFSTFALLNNSGTGVLAAAANFQLVYIDADNNECLLVEDVNALADDAQVLLTFPILLGPGDGKVVLRLGALQEAGPVPFTGTLDGYGGYTDVRDVDRVKLDLTTNYQTLVEGVQGGARLISPISGEDPTPLASVLNFDSVDHTVEMRLTDGVNTIQLPTVSAAAVVSATAAAVDIVSPMLLEDWELQARMTVASVDAPVRVVVGVTRTNLSPVRSNQAGAF